MQIIISLIDFLKSAVWPLFLVWVLTRYGAAVGTHASSILQSLLPRLREAGATGLKFDPALEAARQEYLPPTESLRDFRGESRTVAMQETEKGIHSNLAEMVKEGKIQSEECLDYIVKQLAFTRLIAHFEKTYWLIFGSQLRGLQYLKEHGTAKTEQAKKLYEETKAADPEFYKDYPFEGWFSFLQNQLLVQTEGDEIRLTPIGDDFLQFVFARNLSTNKRG